jgi:glycosyltransferase involved in cell wall biosynthesis
MTIFERQDRRRAASAPAHPSTSIVIPTRDEANNVPGLLDRLSRAVPRGFGEIIFVDDSDDGTLACIERHSTLFPLPMRVLHRAPGLRSGGLGGAVLQGFRIASGEWLCVMDGDLQHPPELITSLLAEATHSASDVVVASRYRGGSAGPPGRPALVSRTATVAARRLFPTRLRGISDPMSGFFVVRRDKLDLDTLRPRGFKILLEVLVRTPGLRVSEVGFDFGVRTYGRSKLGLREALRYACHLGSLRLRPSEAPRWPAAVRAR